jgi:hypothetical protein
VIHSHHIQAIHQCLSHPLISSLQIRYEFEELDGYDFCYEFMELDIPLYNLTYCHDDLVIFSCDSQVNFEYLFLIFNYLAYYQYYSSLVLIIIAHFLISLKHSLTTHQHFQHSLDSI